MISMIKTLPENMGVSDLLKHFDFIFDDPTFLYSCDPEKDAQWIICVDPCRIGKIKVRKDDLLLYDKRSGQLLAHLHPINRLIDLDEMPEEAETQTTNH